MERQKMIENKFAELDNARRDLRGANLPKQMAQSCLRCIGLVMELFRLGGIERFEASSEYFRVKRDTLEGLQEIFSDHSESPLHLPVETKLELANAVRNSEDEDSIPPEIIDRIFEISQKRLQAAFWMMYFETNGIPIHITRMLGDLIASYDKSMYHLPCPTQVSQRLQQISKEYYLDGSPNPQLQWWDSRTDRQKASRLMAQIMNPDAMPQSEPDSHDWDKAPLHVKRADQQAALDHVKKHFARSSLKEWCKEVSKAIKGAAAGIIAARPQAEFALAKVIPGMRTDEPAGEFDIPVLHDSNSEADRDLSVRAHFILDQTLDRELSLRILSKEIIISDKRNPILILNAQISHKPVDGDLRASLKIAEVFSNSNGKSLCTVNCDSEYIWKIAIQIKDVPELGKLATVRNPEILSALVQNLQSTDLDAMFYFMLDTPESA